MGEIWQEFSRARYPDETRMECLKDFAEGIWIIASGVTLFVIFLLVILPVGLFIEGMNDEYDYR